MLCVSSAPEQAASLLTGYLYRESGVVNGITNKRWAALYPHSLVTWRKEGSKESSKSVALHRKCQLTNIKSKEFMLRDKHTSTIWALAAGHYERKELVSMLCLPLSFLSYCLSENSKTAGSVLLCLPVLVVTSA